MGSGSTLLTSFYLNALLKDPMSKYNHFLPWFHHTNLGGHSPVHDKPRWDFTRTCLVDSKLYLEHGRLQKQPRNVDKEH